MSRPEVVSLAEDLSTLAGLGAFFERRSARCHMRRDAAGVWRCEVTLPEGALRIGVSARWSDAVFNAVRAIETDRFLVRS